MNIGEFVDYQLLKTDRIEITVLNLVIVLVVFFATLIGLRIIRVFFTRYISKKKAERRSIWSVFLILRYVIWVVVTVLLLETSGVKISVLLASITALLVGVGFGIQQLFSDIA